MANGQTADEIAQQRLDARMEYGHLVTVYLALANMMWVGFGAFFTINTLLVTGLGFSYTETAKAMPADLLYFLHLAIPVTGACISLIAVYAANLIRDAQRQAHARGSELETLLSAKMFGATAAVSFPYATALGSGCFFTMWGAVIAAVIKH